MTIPLTPYKPEQAPALDAMSKAVGDAASALAKALDIWQANFDGDAWTPETSYPFDKDFQEVVMDVFAWSDGIAEDANVTAGRA